MSTRKLAILYNKVVYDHELMRDESVVQQADLHWIPINSVIAQQYPVTIQKSEVKAQDLAISMGVLTEFKDSSLFDFKAEGFQPIDNFLPSIPNIKQLVTIELSSDLTVIKRFNYGLMQMLVQLGGFFFLWGIMVMVFVGALNYDEQGYHLASRLYRRRTSDSRSEDLRKYRCANLQGYCIDRFFGKACRTWYVNNSTFDERALERARMEATKETDTVELVRQLRFFQQAMAILLTADEIERMKQDCKYYTVDGEKIMDTPMHEG